MTTLQRKILRNIVRTNNAWPAEAAMCSADCRELMRMGFVEMAPSAPEDYYATVRVTKAGLAALNADT